jgi:hypothetical protein
MRFDLRGSCRSCGTKIATIKKPTGLAIPKTWNELWPTLLISGFLAAIGAAFVVGGLYMLQGFVYENVRVRWSTCGTGSIVVGGAFVIGAIKCWLK